MRHMTVTILTLAVLVCTAHAADPPGAEERFAQGTSEAIKAKEEALAAAGDRVSTAIRRFKKEDASSQDLTFEEMQKHLAVLRPFAEEVLKGYGDFRTASESLRKEIIKSPGAYKLAAAALREKAKTYETDELRRRVLDWADNCERLVPIMEGRAKRLDAVAADTAKMERFLTETNRFLGDFESFLKLYPGNQSLEVRRNYRSQLEIYKKAFEEMLKNMDAFTDKLKAESGSAKLRAERAEARAKKAAAREQEAAARAQEAAADAERRRAEQVAAVRAAYQWRMRKAYEVQLLQLRYVYSVALRYPRTFYEAQVAARGLQEVELRLYALRNGA